MFDPLFSDPPPSSNKTYCVETLYILSLVCIATEVFFFWGGECM
ncbi:unnamed protein product [Staurois parvus]|uniref:Uncharacterized protein n=1 Tax=Staurois parvus TaxID=386267 RepID=A0ABN9EA50_9NEOB|nr:unnamed protein product [Staurois parvus]